MNLSNLVRFALDGYRAYNGDAEAAKRVLAPLKEKAGDARDKLAERRSK
jgi:hypothetical protein